ncbi:recombinase family protein [Paenibacillus puldeungensis]|uniref:Recombinase family protein n=1 Tax=Paenibacillus puldeungensis TaxID=696536 RepID=A0ABW3S494_9BACL
MQVFGYPRVSTDEQADKGNSLNEQMERMTAYCKAMGWDDPIFFIEDGFSAKNLNRPEMTKMLERIKNDPYGGIVLTTKLDRLSRKLFDILSLNVFFNKHGFNYVSATEGFDTSTPAGRLVLQMLGMVAEFERERISERVRDNMTSIARNTTKVISRPCFGYDIVDGEMVINIDESIEIIKAANELLDGKAARSIIKRWNLIDKIKTKEGNEWHEKTFRELLQRETLIGDFVYNKTYKNGTKIITRPENEWIYVENHHPAIIDKETFEKLQNLFKGRKSVGRHFSDDRYLLSGLVVCGHCKNKMNGKIYKSFSKKMNKENIRYKYLCDGYLKKANCFFHNIDRDLLEKTIQDRIIEISQSAPGSMHLLFSKPKTDSIDKAGVKAKLAKLDKRMQKQIDAYNDDLITAHDLKLASEKVEKERAELRKLLDDSSKAHRDNSVAKLVDRAKSSVDVILSGDRIKIKQIIHEIVDKIEVINGEELSIVWRAD